MLLSSAVRADRFLSTNEQIINFIILLSADGSGRLALNFPPAQSPERYMPFKMTLRKILELTFLAFSFCACNQTSKQFGDLKAVNTTKGGTAKTLIINSDKSTKIVDSSINSDSVEDKIIDTIFKLREVKQEAKYIEKQTEGTRHLIVLIADTPHFPDKKYYWVRVK